MTNSLPSRPNLDHLRRQAKALLSAFRERDLQAVETIREYLPTAKKLSEQLLLETDLRLADAQSAIARKTGFSSWPQLTRHVEQLRSLEGTWNFASLEIGGQTIPIEALRASRVLIDGDRFRTESPEATYEGVFNIDVETTPHRIDIEFIEGPEAGNWNYGIFRLENDALRLCLDMTGKGRPVDFRTSPDDQFAFETLHRSSNFRPDQVTGGTRPSATKQSTLSREPCSSDQTLSIELPVARESDFEYRETSTSLRLQGDWLPIMLNMDGKPLEKNFLGYGIRSTIKNEMKVIFGGNVMAHALVRYHEDAVQVTVDYFNLAGKAKGTLQYGILKWDGDDAVICMASAGKPRPDSFESGPGITLGQWRKKSQ